MVISINVLSEFILLGFAWFSLFNWKSRKSNNPEFLFTEALHCLVKQDKKTAVSLLQKVVKKDTDHIEAYLLLGKTIRDKYPEQAIKIHQSLTIRPGLSKSVTIAIHKALAEDYKSLNSLKLAKRECEYILKLDRRNTWAVELMLNIAEEKEDWSEAEKWNRLLAKILGNNSTLDLGKFHIYSGIEKMESGDQAGAKYEFNKAIKLSPTSSKPFLYLGKIYKSEGKKNDALNYLKQFVLLESNPNKNIYKEIESILFELNQYSDIENIYENIVDKFPENREALVRLINYKVEIGNEENALSYLEAFKNNSMTIKLLKFKLSIIDTLDHEERLRLDDLIIDSLETE